MSDIKKKKTAKNAAKKPRINKASNKVNIQEEALSEEKSVLEEVLEEQAAQDNVKGKSLEMIDSVEFDWNTVLSSDEYSEKEKKDLEDQYSSTLPELIAKQVIDGVVVMISDREVVVDINFKSDGIISFNEFKYNPDLKIGDIVEVLVEKQEDKNGQLILSHRRARVLRAWEKVNEALHLEDNLENQS